MEISPITDEQFRRFKDLIYKEAGISLAPQKKALVAGRLAKRLRHHHLPDYGAYFRLVSSHQHTGEFQMMVDLLTTNETYFFREPKHFDFLTELWQREPPGPDYRLWSAACSSGEEVYTLAMLLTEQFGQKSWEIVGSDISTRMLESCQRAVYPMSRAAHIPEHYLHQYCLKGVREQEGMLLMDRKIRAACQFRQINLMEPLPAIGRFNVIFLRNVMIYFDPPTKVRLLERILPVLKPGGYFFISHSESLHGVSKALRMVRPSIYQKPYKAESA